MLIIQMPKNGDYFAWNEFILWLKTNVEDLNDWENYWNCWLKAYNVAIQNSERG